MKWEALQHMVTMEAGNAAIIVVVEAMNAIATVIALTLEVPILIAE